MTKVPKCSPGSAGIARSPAPGLASSSISFGSSWVRCGGHQGLVTHWGQTQQCCCGLSTGLCPRPWKQCLPPAC